MDFIAGYIACSFILVFAIILSIFAQAKVTGTFSRYSEVPSSFDMTGAELAEKLAYEKVVNINIGVCRGQLTDHYNSRTKTLNISEANYNSKSLAAHAIVAHEFGHALQDKENYAPLKIRQIVISVSNIISSLLLPIIIVGLLLEFLFFTIAGPIIIYAYVGIYAVAVIASLVTLPVEFNASSRAKKLLFDMGATSQEEVEGTGNLLNAAAMTYVASLLVSLAYFIRILFILLSVTKRDWYWQIVVLVIE